MLYRSSSAAWVGVKKTPLSQLSNKVFCVIFECKFLMEPDANESTVRAVTPRNNTTAMQITRGSPVPCLAHLH